jgi:hypothetical protein
MAPGLRRKIFAEFTERVGPSGCNQTSAFDPFARSLVGPRGVMHTWGSNKIQTRPEK